MTGTAGAVQASEPITNRAGGLSLRGVRKHFGGVKAVDGIDLDVAPGDALAVIGPNGAGKSTLLKLISGIHRCDEGEIHFAGYPLGRLDQHRIVHRGVAMAHQVPRPFANLSVRDNVMVGAVSRRGDHAAPAAAHVDEVLELCALSAKADLPAGSLRVLDLKRLEVARALATSPRLLLLDEVAAGLVGRELEEAIALIRRVHATGVTLVLVEHVERVVREVVERVMVLDWGRAIAEGTPAEVAADEQVRAVYLGHASEPADSRRAPVVDPDAERVLDLDGLTAGHGDIVALRDVSLHIAQGEIVAVLGANGAGKSTLAGAISGAVSARKGRVAVLGEDVTGWPAHRRARLGVAHCQEGRRVFAQLTVAENLALGAPLALKASDLSGRLDRVHSIFPVLAERASQRAGTLSGGQQQMLAVGRALMAEPRLLICDELSLGLAPVATDALYEALAAINASGVAILLVEQNVHRALRLSDRAYVLSRGRISYAGSPEALLEATSLDQAYFGHDDGAGETGAAANR